MAAFGFDHISGNGNNVFKGGHNTYNYSPTYMNNRGLLFAMVLTAMTTFMDMAGMDVILVAGTALVGVQVLLG